VCGVGLSALLYAMVCFLRKMFEIEQLSTHHNKVSPWQKRSRQPTDWPCGVFDGRLGKKAAAVLGLWDNEIAYQNIPKDAGPDCVRLVPDRQMSIVLEVDQLKKEHHSLTDGKLIRARDELLRALPAQVVDPIIAVGGDPHLTKPTKYGFRSGLNRYPSMIEGVERLSEAVAGKREQKLLLSGPPMKGYRHCKSPVRKRVMIWLSGSGEFARLQDYDSTQPCKRRLVSEQRSRCPLQPGLGGKFGQS